MLLKNSYEIIYCTWNITLTEVQNSLKIFSTKSKIKNSLSKEIGKTYI